MKAFILAVCLLLASSAAAEWLPQGCYMAYSKPGWCWIASDGITQWMQYADRLQGANMYGKAIEAIITSGRDCDLNLAATEDSLSSCTAYTNEANISINLLTTLNNAASARIKADGKLVAKLRKVCGVKCKKIK